MLGVHLAPPSLLPMQRYTTNPANYLPPKLKIGDPKVSIIQLAVWHQNFIVNLFQIDSNLFLQTQMLLTKRKFNSIFLSLFLFLTMAPGPLMFELKYLVLWQFLSPKYYEPTYARICDTGLGFKIFPDFTLPKLKVKDWWHSI